MIMGTLSLPRSFVFGCEQGEHAGDNDLKDGKLPVDNDLVVFRPKDLENKVVEKGKGLAKGEKPKKVRQKARNWQRSEAKMQERLGALVDHLLQIEDLDSLLAVTKQVASGKGQVQLQMATIEEFMAMCDFVGEVGSKPASVSSTM